jgi:hypothetical protein
MTAASDGNLPPQATRLRAEVRDENCREIMKSLTKQTTLEAIEATHLIFRNPERAKCHPAELEAIVKEWREFCSAAASGGEVWEYRVVGPCNSSEGFAVIRDGRVVADLGMSVSTWI